MQSVKERIEIMQAWLDGKSVQFKSNMDGTWVPVLATGEPVFGFHDYKFRIAPPEPDYIDWSHVADNWQWLARDKDGVVWLYDTEPTAQGISGWSAVGSCTRASEFKSYRNGGADWTESLYARPTLENNFNGKGPYA